MLLLTVFGMVALVLAAIGIYGLMAYSVAQRTQEIGIRMALGADRAAVRKLVVWQGHEAGDCGSGAGAWAAAFGAHATYGQLPVWSQGLGPPAAFFAAPLILCAVALFAVWLPAMRASRVDPIEALRTE